MYVSEYLYTKDKVLKPQNIKAKKKIVTNNTDKYSCRVIKCVNNNYKCKDEIHNDIKQFKL